MILDVDTLYRIHSNEHSRYVTVRAHQHRHRPAPTPLANAQEMIDFSLTLSGNSRLILKVIHSYRSTEYRVHRHDIIISQIPSFQPPIFVTQVSISVLVSGSPVNQRARGAITRQAEPSFAGSCALPPIKGLIRFRGRRALLLLLLLMMFLLLLFLAPCRTNVGAREHHGEVFAQAWAWIAAISLVVGPQYAPLLAVACRLCKCQVHRCVAPTGIFACSLRKHKAAFIRVDLIHRLVRTRCCFETAVHGCSYAQCTCTRWAV